jgi:7-cyano-7-deazaguanine synthase in queuosine biosynthesis
MIDATVLKSLGETGMTHDVAIETTEAGLPSTFVPGRNLLFLTLAGALAVRRGISVLVGGMCETDYSGYPGLPERHDPGTGRDASPRVWASRCRSRRRSCI